MMPLQYIVKSQRTFSLEPQMPLCCNVKDVALKSRGVSLCQHTSFLEAYDGKQSRSSPLQNPQAFESMLTSFSCSFYARL